MKHPFAILLPALAAAGILGSGCVAIPMGTETFTTEYPADVRPTAEPPTKTYKVEPVVTPGDESHHTVAIGIKGSIITQQPMIQTFKGGEVVKKKRLSIGLFPMTAKNVYHPKGALTPISTSMYYRGNGRYSSSNFGITEPCGEMDGGKFITALTLGILPTPFCMVAGIFGPYEHDYHFLGGTVENHSSTPGVNSVYESTTYSSDDIDLLLKFPMSEREKIGAWTYHENSTHPHNTFWNGFQAQWFGFFKYCNYFVKDLGGVQKTTAAPPTVKTEERVLAGPYSVILSLPSLGYYQTVEVSTGANKAEFQLLDAANGDSFTNGTVRFLPSSTGLAAVRNEDDRALLELAMEREWPVTVALPVPRLSAMQPGNTGTTPQQPQVEFFQISSIEPKADSLVVRVTVNDASKTFDIDRKVQPEVRRMFRAQFATGPNADRRESVRMAVDNGGKSLVYTVTFE